jgi:hypothetical protein
MSVRSKSLAKLFPSAGRKGLDRSVVLSTSCPVFTEVRAETKPGIRSWVAFAEEKLVELSELRAPLLFGSGYVEQVGM